MSSAFRQRAFVPGTNQVMTTSGSTQQSAAVGSKTTVVRIAATADAFFEIGANPTATTSSMVIPGGTVDFLAIAPGHKVAVLQVALAGKVSVTENAAPIGL